MTRSLVFGAIVACTVGPLALSAAQAQDNFYEGKTVNIVIGTAGGGSLSLAAEMVGRHLGKHIPGNPTVINTQMPGGAHQIATNHVYAAAEPDGLTILAANPNVGVAQLAGLETVQFDVTKFNWLGSSGADGAMFAIRASLPYQTFEEIQNLDTPLVAGTTGPGSNAHDFPLLLEEFAGAKLRLVPGYPSNGDILLALERGEADTWAALGTTVHRQAETGAVRPLVRSRTALPGYEDLPVDEDLATNETGKRLFGIRGIPLSIGRAFAVGPNVPEDRVAILREAFRATIEDPDFLAEAEQAGIVMSYISYEDIEAGFADLLDQPPEVLEAMNTYLKVGD
jgi:tripartite-type tricarboxylate transporter receptor subunit TctC